MADTPTGPIAVYGATGYTGRLVAAELRRRGADAVLAGRSEAKLEIVAEDLGAVVRIEAAPLDDSARLRAAFAGCTAVIACAGPFERYGEPVLEAAIASGAHYVDTTGEQSFMRRVFERHGTAAERAGVAAVPAMGFDYAPGDMIAALAAEGMKAVDEVVLAYATRGFGASRGTMRTALGQIGGDDVEWRDGELRPAERGLSRGEFDFPPPIGRQRMVRYPAGEHITVPRHVPTRRVRTMLAAATVAPHARLARLVPVAMTPVQWLARTPARRLAEAVVSRFPEGPSTEDRRRPRFTVVCDVRAGSRARRGVVRGRDVYGLTARSTVEAALRLGAPDYDRAGVLAPSEAFEPRDFLGALAAAGLEYEIVPLRS